MARVEVTTPKGRLLFLADALERNARNPKGMKFDLLTWLDNPNGAPDISCGTAGCAVGLAMMLPEFQAQGFGKAVNAVSMWIPAFDVLRNFDAVQKFFGIDMVTAGWLFSSHTYTVVRGAKAELAVAARIRILLKVDYGE